MPDLMKQVKHSDYTMMMMMMVVMMMVVMMMMTLVTMMVVVVTMMTIVMLMKLHGPSFCEGPRRGVFGCPSPPVVESSGLLPESSQLHSAWDISLFQAIKPSTGHPCHAVTHRPVCIILQALAG